MQLQNAKNGSRIEFTPTNSAKSTDTQKTTMINQSLIPRILGLTMCVCV